LFSGYQALRRIGPRGARIALIVLGAGWILGGVSQLRDAPLSTPEYLRDERYERKTPEPPMHRKIRGAFVLPSGIATLLFAAAARPAKPLGWFARATVCAATLASAVVFAVEKLEQEFVWTDALLIVLTMAVAVAFTALVLHLIKIHETGEKQV
jgi:hypothetical protein